MRLLFSRMESTALISLPHMLEKEASEVLSLKKKKIMKRNILRVVNWFDTLEDDLINQSCDEIPKFHIFYY